jgi:hypothetical protein
VLAGDAHVHLHRCFDPDRLFETAAARGQALGGPLLLLLSECQGDRAFEVLRGRARGEEPDAAFPASHRFRLATTDEPTSVAFLRTEASEPAGFLIAGRQLVSREGIEVLGLALDPAHPASATSDRLHSAETLLRSVLDAGAVAVLPWGLGKWLGARGARAAAFAADPAFQEHPLFLLGDTAHRFRPWPRPRLLRPPARVLAGSDLLPVAGAERRVGRYGFRIDAPLDPGRPAAALLDALRSRKPIAAYGRRESLASTAAEQIRFRRGRSAA